MNNNLEELKKLPFESALEQLEDIVGKMESGNLPLDQMISFFEQGNALKNVCSHKLNELEKKIEVLVKEDAQGGQWTDFDPENPRQEAVASPAPAQFVEQVAQPQVNTPQQPIAPQTVAPESNDLLF